MITRRDVAAHLGAHLEADRSQTIRAVAAWLVSTKRTRQVPYLVREVATQLEDQGYVYAEATTAHPSTPAARQDITAYITGATGAKEVELVENVDPTVVGGLRLELPTRQLDQTIRHRLQSLEELGA